MTHTPLPWKIEERISQGIYIIGNIPEGYDKTVCLMRWTSPLVPKEKEMEDAEFIVRACNSHDELLEALENLLDTFYWYETEKYPHTETSTAINKSRKAIRKAKDK